MKKTVWVALVGVILFSISACQDNQSKNLQNKVEQKDSQLQKVDNAELVLKFLSGAQKNDKILMYEATNLNITIINESRDKLIHPSKYNQTAEQAKTNENILRISGEIDYFTGKIRKLFPKSVSFKIEKSAPSSSDKGTSRFDHTVLITYNDRAEALSDKTGKPVKIMKIHLFQATTSVDGRLIHSFSFDNKGFDRFADRDFEVVSYY